MGKVRFTMRVVKQADADESRTGFDVTDTGAKLPEIGAPCSFSLSLRETHARQSGDQQHGICI